MRGVGWGRAGRGWGHGRSDRGGVVKSDVGWKNAGRQRKSDYGLCARGERPGGAGVVRLGH